MLSSQNFIGIVVALVGMGVLMGMVAYTVLWERRVAAWIQDRVGPNRAGPLGLLQPFADGIKLLLKEDYTPPFVDRMLYTLAPCFLFIPALIGWAIIPWGGAWAMPEISLPILGAIGGEVVQVTVADINIGIIYLLAVASLGVYGTVLGGYASNNKYSFLGGMRATAQMISYEVPMGLCLLSMLLLAGSVRPSLIVEAQTDGMLGWFIFHQPLVAILFYICLLAEAGRAPFDLIEAEQELVGGYHTEYSSMRFALYFLGEYAHLIVGSAFFAILFLGGWQLLPIGGLMTGEAGIGLMLLRVAVLLGKIAFLVTFAMVVRWTLPRLRFDQLMRVAWQVLIPLTLVALVVTSVMLRFGLEGWLWLANIVMIVGLVAIQPLLPKVDTNQRLPLRGSRFCPPEDESKAGLGLTD
ncbi:MAG: NADH-quinone oxidoreductase subunit NuoH [Phycisphaerales bacterium JB038]